MPLRLGCEPSGVPALSDSIYSVSKLLAISRVGVKKGLDEKGKAKQHIKKNWCDRVNAYIGKGMTVKDAMSVSSASNLTAT